METNSLLNIFIYISNSETSEKRNKDPNLNYFTDTIFAELIVLFILIELYMNMEICELTFYLLLHFQSLKLHLLDSKINRLLFIQRNKF